MAVRLALEIPEAQGQVTTLPMENPVVSRMLDDWVVGYVALCCLPLL